MCSAFIFKEIANLINVKPETARSGSFLLPSPDVSSHSTPYAAAGSPSIAPHGHGAGGEPGISHAKAQPEPSVGGLEGEPPRMLSLGASLRAGARALIWWRKLKPCFDCHNPAMSSLTRAPPKTCHCCPRGEGTASIGS